MGGSTLLFVLHASVEKKEKIAMQIMSGLTIEQAPSG
jgi:hypothetical protein